MLSSSWLLLLLLLLLHRCCTVADATCCFSRLLPSSRRCCVCVPGALQRIVQDAGAGVVLEKAKLDEVCDFGGIGVFARALFPP